MKNIFTKIGTAASLGAIALSNATLAAARTDVTSFGVDTLAGSGGSVVTDDPATLIKNVVTLIFIVAGAITFAYLIFGAIKWITSGGDKSKVEEARNKITSAIIGLLILVAVWAIFNLVITVAFGSGNITVTPLSGS